MQTNIAASSPAPSSADLYRIRPRQAWTAVQALLKNPQETEHVFTVIRALSGRTIQLGHTRFVNTRNGQRITSENRNLLTTLSDRESLTALPAGTLGREYLAFMQAQGITAEGLAAASMEDNFPHAEEHALYARRLRDMHDLWHVVSGYGPDTMGEVCLLGFTYGQTQNPGLGFIAVMGALKIGREDDRDIYRALWAGYRAGRRAEWLPAADWEALLAQPLEQVRRELKIAPPARYDKILERRLAAV